MEISDDNFRVTGLGRSGRGRGGCQPEIVEETKKWTRKLHLECERKPKEKKTRKMDLSSKENGGDSVIEEKKKKNAMEVEMSTSKKKKKTEKKSLYLDENPLNAV